MAFQSFGPGGAWLTATLAGVSRPLVLMGWARETNAANQLATRVLSLVATDGSTYIALVADNDGTVVNFSGGGGSILFEQAQVGSTAQGAWNQLLAYPSATTLDVAVNGKSASAPVVDQAEAGPFVSVAVDFASSSNTVELCEVAILGGTPSAQDITNAQTMNPMQIVAASAGRLTAIAYWPLRGDLLDYSGNNNALSASSGTASFASDAPSVPPYSPSATTQMLVIGDW